MNGTIMIFSQWISIQYSAFFHTHFNSMRLHAFLDYQCHASETICQRCEEVGWQAQLLVLLQQQTLWFRFMLVSTFDALEPTCCLWFSLCGYVGCKFDSLGVKFHLEFWRQAKARFCLSGKVRRKPVLNDLQGMICTLQGQACANRKP